MDNQNIKSSVKATSLFGGVEVWGILVSIIKTKLIAILIGPIGVGLMSMYQATIGMITTATNFSLFISSVRDVSVAYNSGDKQLFTHKISVLSKLVWLTGLLGLFICLLGAPLWSKLTFDNYDYTVGFAALSVVLLLNQLNSGKTVLMQGTGHFKYIAYSGIIGNTLGLFTTIPIYYFWGIDGVVAVIIIGALTTFSLSYYYASKLKFEFESLKIKEVYSEGKEMLRQGMYLSINAATTAAVFYILRLYITKQGGLVEMGLFAASYAIITTYVGLVFQAMSREYYPRLSSLSYDSVKFNEAINDQIHLTLLLLGPLVFFFLSFSGEIIELFYSDKFVGASLLMSISMLGVVFQAPVWCMAYALLSKSDNKAYLFWESFGKLQKILTDVLFYYLWGLTGLGISFLISYMYYTIQYAFVCKSRYGFSLSKRSVNILLIYFVIGSTILYVSQSYSLIICLIVGLIFTTFAGIYSFRELNDLLNLSSVFRNLKNRIRSS